MFKHNLKIGYRSLVREKAYATVNIVGMAVCLVIFQYVHFQMSYNTFHSNHQNTYRAVLKEVNSPTREKDPYTPPSEAPHARGFYVTRGRKPMGWSCSQEVHLQKTWTMKTP